LKQGNKTLFSKQHFENNKKHFGFCKTINKKNKNIEVGFKQPQK
jgi:hypothetical protein